MEVEAFEVFSALNEIASILWEWREEKTKTSERRRAAAVVVRQNNGHVL
jgi:hypothetical protein